MYGLLIAIGALLGIAGLVYWKIIKPHSYWIVKGVKQGKQTFFFGDSAGQILRKHSLADMVQYVYNKFPNNRYSGMYQMLLPTLVIRDPELIKQVTVKDFDHFTDRMAVLPEDYEPLWTRNLLSLKGDKWRDMRATLSPAFTSSKMKSMFFLMSECAEQFTNYFLQDKNGDSVELKDIFTRYTNDVIATCAFGIKCDSLKERNNEFYLMGKEATDFTGFWKSLKFLIFVALPKLSLLLGFTIFSKSVSNFFTNLVQNTVKEREEKNIVRPDMINLLMEASKGQLYYEEKQTESKETGFATAEESDIGKVVKKHKEDITNTDMTAQALLFFFAGFDSVSTLMCFMGYEMAINPDIQERLYDEITETLNECNGKLTYDAVNNMKYLDMIVAETLRKWPAGVAADRLCIDSYTIPAKEPDEVDVHLKKGDLIWIPIWGIHRDPKHYLDPEKFDPERFSDENKANIKPYTYLPFGMGPRNCIGSRFALLEAKTVFVHLISKLELCVTEKTQIPLKLSRKGFNLNGENGFWLKLKPRTN